ncbi:MAG: cupin domain-containing protein [Bacteroidetes bacterium]|nr:MAG: cupin domain-containing protein [Bacteroidota bacterium]
MQAVSTSFWVAFLSSICVWGNLSGQTMQTPPALSEHQTSIISIAALTAKGDLGQLKEACNTGLDAGLPILTIRECIVHTYAYCGFPRSIRGLQSLMEVLEQRKSAGIQDVMGRDASPIRQEGGKYERGKHILNELTKAPQDRPLTGYGVFAPVIDTFLKEHLFADLFERDVLSYTERELVTISVLSAIGHAEPMLRSHFTICLNVGLTPEQLNAFVDVIRATLGESEAQRALGVLNEVLGKGNPATAPAEMTPPHVFPKGEKVVSSHFTGTVWLHMLVNTDTTLYLNAGHVTFAPGARTHWHRHPGGQILLVTSGKGRYQEQGKPVIEIRQGDVIQCNPNVKHWHGAAPDSELSHIAIGPNQDKGPVEWLEAVTEKEYHP